MAVLPDIDRQAVCADYMQKLSAELNTMTGLVKADLRAAVNGLDAFMNTNATAINTAIPQPARTALTTPQKARLLQFVISRRYLAGV